ncbi:MAG: zinc-binding dehydrogenase [Candidatus Velthaea sp.]
MRAIRTTGHAEMPIAAAHIPVPTPQPGEALVRVHAVSLNAGELRRARNRAANEPIGWDFAGVVVRAAENGRGPQIGTRVVSFVDGGAWADFVAAPAHQLGTLPDSVSFDDAATLPIAGLTALRALRRGGDIKGKRVLISPATGGAGLFALQLAAHAGADVTALIRNAERETLVRECGAARVVIGNAADAAAHKPYDLIIDSLGGNELGTLLEQLAFEGTVVNFGPTTGEVTTFSSRAFMLTGGVTLYGLYIFADAEARPIADDLNGLAQLVAHGNVRTNIDATLSFDEFERAFTARKEGSLPGKVVVRLA